MDGVAGERRGSRGRGPAGLAVGLALLALVAAFGVRAALRGEAEREPTLEERYLQDDRIRPLIYDCNFGKTFSAPTTDMIGVLVSKLNLGARDPLRIAKSEVAAAGEAAIPPLRRLFDEAFQDPWRAGVVENVLATVALMDEPWGIEIARLGLRHMQESTRLVALDVLRRHGDASDYDEVLGLMPSASNPGALADYASCLEDLDPERYYADLATWLEEGQYAGAWSKMIVSVTAARAPGTVAKLRDLAEVRDEQLIPFLLAPAARDGDQEALDALHQRLASEHVGQRQLALQALGRVGHALDAVHILQDSHAALRTRAYELIAAEEPTPEIDAWLQEGLSDHAFQVREVCLLALVERGNPYATAHALELLGGNLIERNLAIRALRGGWDANEGSAEAAFERLQRLFEVSQGSGSSERVSILQAMSHVPLREAAELLMTLGEKLEGSIKGLDPFRWCAGQVFNTGPEGRELLRARLAVETDPFRRLSLIEYVWQDHSDEGREALLGILEDEALDPYERLYAADRLLRLGPASRVAPVLKRVYLACAHATVRPAMQCMLWTWYGQHYDIPR